MFHTKVNQNKSFDIDYENGEYKINSKKVKFDCLPTASSHFHLLLDNQSFNVELIGIDYNLKKVELKINNGIYHVSVSDHFDQLLVKMGFDKGSQHKISALKAPMPGLVLSIAVGEGDKVKEGDALLVLEAMKMENVLPSPTTGTISKISVAAGEKVEKNQTLVLF